MSRSACARPLWASDALRRAAGDTLRPGGLDLTEHALALAGVHPGGRVLDVGCGLGTTVRHLAGLGYLAVGLDASARQIAAGPGGLPLAVADARVPPLRDLCLDAVLCECVLSLLDDPGAALAALGRSLVPGGRLAVTDLCLRPGPCAVSGQGAPVPPEGCAAGALDLDDFLDRVRAAGFEPMALENHDKLLKELAARLILAGAPSEVYRPCDGAVCAAPRLGYFLLTARRTGGAS